MLRHESLPRPMPLKYAVPFWMSGVFSIVFYIANLVVDVQGTCAWDQGHCRKRQNAFNGPILWFLRSVRCSVWGARMVSFLHPGLMAFPRRCTACVPTRQSTCKQRVHDIRSTEGSAKMLSVGMVSSLHLGLMVFPQRCTACVPTRQSTCKQRVHGIRSTDGSAKKLSMGDVRRICASPGARRMRQNVSQPILPFLRSVRCSVCDARMVSSLHPAMMVFPQRCTA
ncbi:uncharacterized protein LOC142589914 isoform X3 [Dermacentor variabilis]|uniref:uncharacterized protein LOC142589914 isoform X3 n=1 Tax=Dermacentor variabilis TaxID=34621 RepID=UPI003F5BD411